MALLPAGFALPPLPYLLAILLAGGAVVLGLRRRDPQVSDRLVLALVPWMLVGAWLHVLHVVGAVPDPVDPLLGTPGAYFTTAILAGAVWFVADALSFDTEHVFAGAGAVLAGVLLAVGLRWGLDHQSLSVAWPTIAAVLGVTVGLGVWAALLRAYPEARIAGFAGGVAVVAHSVDGISTAIGVDILGATERTPLSRFIIELGAALPTADLIGSVWLFVLVKLALGAGITALLAETVREVPRQGRLLLVFVAAVGLGPGAHNLLLFAIWS